MIRTHSHKRSLFGITLKSLKKYFLKSILFFNFFIVKMIKAHFCLLRTHPQTLLLCSTLSFTVSTTNRLGTTMGGTGWCGSSLCLGATTRPRCWKSLMSARRLTPTHSSASSDLTTPARCSASVSLPTSLLASKPTPFFLRVQAMVSAQLATCFYLSFLKTFFFLPFLNSVFLSDLQLNKYECT